MPDPVALLAVARMLTQTIHPATADAQLRRAVSTAYYAMFHKILRAAAERFMGPGGEAHAGYRLIYRSFEHGRVREVCQQLSAANLNSAIKRDLARSTISRDMLDFVSALPEIQRQRHAADYDPNVQFQLPDVTSLIDAVETAMAAFARADPAEQADILALMMTRPRL